MNSDVLIRISQHVKIHIVEIKMVFFASENNGAQLVLSFRKSLITPATDTCEQ